MHELKPQPAAVPPVVDKETFQQRLDQQISTEKALTKLGDAVSAARRRLPMVEVENYTFAGPHGGVTLTDLFGEHYQLLVQHFMFGPDWDQGCPSCTYGVDCLPANMGRMDEERIAFAIISQAPVQKLESWRAQRGWEHTWVSSGDTTFHYDWDWTQRNGSGQEWPIPGYSYYLLKDDKPYLTYTTRARGAEPHIQLAGMMDRTLYGRQEDWEDSPEGWPQYPTYG